MVEQRASSSLVGGAPADPSARTQRYLLAGLLASLLLWNLPYGWVLLYPFKLFATWLHEGSHAVLMVLGGAGVDRLDIYRDTSGLAIPHAGVTAAAQAVISSAGYMGTAFFGALFLVLGRTRRGARVVLLVLAGLLAASAAFWVRNRFGLVAVMTGAMALGLAGWLAGPGLAAFVVNFLAAQACILAVLDIRVLFAATVYVDGKPYAQSDAHIVADIIGGPYWVWAAMWMAWSFGLFYLALRLMRRKRSS
jgi:hypothetical protein